MDQPPPFPLLEPERGAIGSGLALAPPRFVRRGASRFSYRNERYIRRPAYAPPVEEDFERQLYFFTLTRSRHRIPNLLSILLRKRGALTLNNGSRLKFAPETKRGVTQLFLFSLKYGAEIQNRSGYWGFDPIRNQVLTPSGLRFDVRGFEHGIFAETFLYDIHFCDDLKGRTVVQAGGFVGDTALHYAEQGATVYSFEPGRSSYELASRNLELNPTLSPKVVMRNFAIGRDGYVDFPQTDVVTGGGSVFDAGSPKTAQVRSISIASILKEFHIEDPYLLDLDIKGKEFDVIEDRDLGKFHRIRIEYTPDVTPNSGGRELLLERLREYGFGSPRIFKHNSGSYDLHRHGTIECSRSET